ncbi:MAG: histidinol phosphate phosphatase [Elusimicrobia bacterium CG_4_8_14_3_um_filter_50_9]|nr:MAG: histidinol phosphate phosphatase [Elusimicrobia bacterium CG_4_8_14_3_um_filter_50_9]
MNKLNTTLVILTLNELEGMRVIMPQINKDWVDQIIIVDGGSTDGTIEFARKSGYFVHIQRKPGLRNAYMEIYDLIEGDILITFSPDGNSVSEMIPPLIKKMEEGYDMVIVSRYKDGAKSYDDDFITAFGNWFFTNTINLLFGSEYTDAMVMFRAYKKSLIKDLALDKDETYTPEKWFCTNISWEPILSVRAAKRKLRLGEIPGDEPPRIGGERKLQVIRWGGAYFVQFLREIFYWK